MRAEEISLWLATSMRRHSPDFDLDNPRKKEKKKKRSSSKHSSVFGNVHSLPENLSVRDVGPVSSSLVYWCTSAWGRPLRDLCVVDQRTRHVAASLAEVYCEDPTARRCLTAVVVACRAHWVACVHPIVMMLMNDWILNHCCRKSCLDDCLWEKKKISRINTISIQCLLFW